MADKYADDIREEMRKAKEAGPATAQDSFLHPDLSLVPKPGSQPTPALSGLPSRGVPYRLPPEPSAADIEAERVQEQNDRAGLNVAAYNSQRRAYDAAKGLPVSEPPQPSGDVVRAQPTPAAQPAQQPQGGGGPSFGAIGATYRDQENALRQQAAGQVAANDAQVVGDARVSGLQAQQAEEADKRAKEQQEVTGRQLDEIHRMSDDASKMRVDPARWWHSQSGFDKVRYMLAAALGGFAAGWTHSPNQALQQINRYMDDDIAAQRTAIEQAHGKVTEARGVLGEMYQRYGSLEKAEAATKLLQINSAINDTKAQVSAAASPTIEANGQIAVAGLEREKLVAQQRFLSVKAPDFKGAEDISKQLAEAQVPAAEQTIKEMGQASGANGGEAPGSSLISRAGRALEDVPLIGTAAKAVRGQPALNYDAHETALAEAVAHAMGQRGEEAIKLNREIIRGNGSPEARRNGLAWAQGQIAAKKRNVFAGQNPRDVDLFQALQSAYGARDKPPPAGLPQGSAP